MAVITVGVHTHTHTQANLINKREISIRNALLMIKENHYRDCPSIGACKCEPIRTVLFCVFIILIIYLNWLKIY